MTGPARRFDVDQLAREHDWAGRLSSEMADRFDERPVVIASSVRSSTGEELTGFADAGARAPAGNGRQAAAADDVGAIGEP